MTPGTDAQSSHTANEILLALRNAIKLGASLVVTLGVAVAVRFWMPRFLGPEDFGILHFSEELAAGIFVLATLGVDTYIRKEVSTRPEHASEFFAALLLLRLVVYALLFALMFLVLGGMHKSPEQSQLAYMFAIGQMFFVLNTTLGSLLQACGRVNSIAIVNAVAKLMWGGGIVIALVSGGRLLSVAVVFALSEVIKVPFLWQAARRHVQLRLQFQSQAMLAILLASLPYFINFVAYRIYVKIDVAMLSAMTSDAEVGWYGAGVNVTYAVFLFLPVLNAVIVPMGARIAQGSESDMNATMRGALRLALALTVPIGVLVGFNADAVVDILYGQKYAPTLRSLQILAPLVPLMYVSVLSSMHLIQLGRIWSVALISLWGLVANPGLNAILIPYFYAHMGDGGAGMAAALATIATEVLVIIPMFIALGRESLDRRLLWFIVRLLAVISVVGAVHLMLDLNPIVRLVLDTGVYTLVAVAIGALPVREIIGGLRSALARRKGKTE